MKKNRFCRFLSLLSAMLAAMQFSSCGLVSVTDMRTESENKKNEIEQDNTENKNNNDTNKKDPPAKLVLPEIKDYLSEFDGINYQNDVLVITSPDTEKFSPDEETPEMISESVYLRNRRAEEAVGVKIVTRRGEINAMLDKTKNSAKSGTFFTDILMIPIYKFGYYAIDSLLLDMRSVQSFDPSAEYFNSSAASAVSGGFATLGITGNEVVSPDSYMSVFVNKDILKKAGADISEIYSSASDGSWTYDILFEYTAAVDALSDASLSLTSETADSRLSDIVFTSSGCDLVFGLHTKTPRIGFTPASSEKAMNNIKKLFSVKKTSEEKGSSKDISASELFFSGRSAFHIESLGILGSLADSEVDFAILPLPKSEEAGNYRTLISNNETLFAIPKNHRDPEYAVTSLSAICAASPGMHAEYVNYAFSNILRDADSANMLDIILNSAVFDFAFAYGGVYPDIAAATYKLVRSVSDKEDISATYEELEKKAAECFTENINIEKAEFKKPKEK